MKLRQGFVSNSSSSSFIVRCQMEPNNLVEFYNDTCYVGLDTEMIESIKAVSYFHTIDKDKKKQISTMVKRLQENAGKVF